MLKTNPKIHIYISCHRTKESSDYIEHCIKNIRNIYSSSIELCIINDNSPLGIPESIKEKIINSEFIGAGEVLPYYYFWKNNKYNDRLISLHDSCFVNEIIPIDPTISCEFLWHAGHHADRYIWVKIMKQLKNNEIIIKTYKNKKLWNVNFGGICSCSWDFLNTIEEKHNALTILVEIIKNRDDRCAFERIMGVLGYLYGSQNKDSIFGSIYEYAKVRLKYCEILKKPSSDLKPIEKVWTGR